MAHTCTWTKLHLKGSCSFVAVLPAGQHSQNILTPSLMPLVYPGLDSLLLAIKTQILGNRLNSVSQSKRG